VVRPWLQYTIGIFLTAAAAAVAFGIGFTREFGDTDAAALGVMYGACSAIAWAASTVGLSELLNLFAALFAAASAGFLATPDKVCAWHHLPLLCP
jgi:drug/metabolite transporter (DMT)-like permease